VHRGRPGADADELCRGVHDDEHDDLDSAHHEHDHDERRPVVPRGVA
jgi:hypothetical protein